MRICLVGHFRGDSDEGVRIVGRSLARQLELSSNQILTVDIASLRGGWELRKFRPDILHFILSPTALGLVAARVLSLWTPSAKTVISAVHPSIPQFGLLRLFKPDLVLAQAKDSEARFASLGFTTAFLPNGVDLDRFGPVAPETRTKLRNEFGIPIDKFIILHLASMTRERNLDVFAKLQQLEGVLVVIVGREGEQVDSEVRRMLQDSGCVVWETHFSSIEKVYTFADCYVFPTRNRRACIETPLSVLEALASGLPVITTRYGALPRVIRGMEGVSFVDDDDEIVKKVKEMMKNRGGVINNQIKDISWARIVERLMSLYQETVSSKSDSWFESNQER